jgi:beta-catenin-like protein 1
LALIVQNLSRLDESRADDKQGIFNSLSKLTIFAILESIKHVANIGLIENLVSVDSKLAETIVENTNLFPWILTRLSVKGFDSVRQYASELLAILLQASQANRTRLIQLNGMDTLLKTLASYRRKDPKDADEVEMMENVFDCLCAVLAEPEGKSKFVEAEGLELMLMMIK